MADNNEQYGLPGKPGEPGEGGAGGKGGEGGEGGAGDPKGGGGVGGAGGSGGAGVIGQRFKPSEPGPHFTESQEDRIITLHGPIIRGLTRFKWYVGAALVVLALGNGFVLQSMKAQRAEGCRTRNAQIIAQNQGAEKSRLFLKRVESAMEEDGLKHTANELSTYIEQAEEAPRLSPIKC